MPAPRTAVNTRRRPLFAALLDRPGLLIAAGLLLAAAAFALTPTHGRPPGFHRDEASAAYNAWRIGHDLHDQDGRFLPLFFVSYGGYLSPLFPYLLAVVFELFGPHAAVARELGAVLVFAAVGALGVLVHRRTRNGALAVGAVVVGALTPWLYELGRTGFEITIHPLTIVLVLLAVGWAVGSERSAVVRGLTVALALAALTYSYAGGRGLGPLYALALVVFAGRGRWRWLLTAWLAYAATLVPLAFDHKAASARYEQTSFVHGGMSWPRIAVDFLWNYVRDANLWHWVVSGDPRPSLHTWGAGQLFGSVVVLALVGAVVVLRRRDLWWRWLLVCLVLSPVPAALTEDRYSAQRLLPLPLLLLVLAAPGLEALLSARTRAWLPRLAVLVLAAGIVTQVVWFEHWFSVRGESARLVVYDAGVPDLLARAFAGGATVYVDHDDRYAQTHALWYAVSHGLARDRVSILPDGGMPPPGSMVFGRFQSCDYVCTRLASSSTYWIAKAVGPKPG